MSPLRDDLDRWVTENPPTGTTDTDRAGRAGCLRYRRWLLLRTVLGVLLALGFLVAAVGLRSVIAGPVDLATTAVLVLSPPSGRAPIKIAADASGSTDGGWGRAIVSYAFDFGDGDTTGPTPNDTAGHAYKKPGLYTVTLTVTDAAGATDQAAGNVQVTKPQKDDPTARLRVKPTSGDAPLKITARGTTSEAAKGREIASYAFDFDDGVASPPSADAAVSHTYTSAGVYTVTLTVTDTNGARDQASRHVNVAAPPKTGPTAKLMVAPTSGKAALGVDADGSTSEAAKGRAIVSYTFDFDDSDVRGPGPDSTAQHTYKTAGEYIVTLTVTDSTGATDKTSKTVKVSTPKTGPTAKLMVAPTSGKAALGVDADGSTSEAAKGRAIVSYTFDFDDSDVRGPGPDSTAQHTYKTAGEYIVTLTVTDSTGATDKTSKTVKVSTPKTGPTAKLMVAPTSGKAALGVDADGSTSEAAKGRAIVSYTFDFDDSDVRGPGPDSTAQHTYKTAGEYIVTLTVTDSTGATDKTSRDVKVS